MKRYVTWPQAILVNKYNDSEWSVHLPITSHDVALLICELVLLQAEKSDSLSIDSEKHFKIVFGLTTESSILRESDSETFAIGLSQQDLWVVLSYLAGWYRDGMAEVNHIDIELEAKSSLGNKCTFVVEADQSKPPLSEEETTRLLRDML